jgi:hypothetical protein
MATDTAFLVCGPRDWIYVLSAVGPTIAAGIAVAVAIWQVVVSHATLRRERRRAAPRLRVQKGLRTTIGGLPEFYFALGNDGETRATVGTLEIAADGQPFAFDPMQPAPAQWAHLLEVLGIVALQGGEANIYVPPFAIAPGETRVFLRAGVQGPNADLTAIVRDRLRFSGTYSSIFGETLTFPTPPPKERWWRRTRAVAQGS